ncbi:MAG: EAL domain-containing protein [Solirubrobacteraceae bacterium]|nr:EAL domain-containing protein [Solirubrobacteraceae bacterium]
MTERQELHRAIRDFTDPLVVMRRVVDQALGLIAAADGAVVELAGGGRLTCVCAAGSMTGHVGRQLRLDASLSGLAVEKGETLQCDDARTDDRVDHDACRQVGLISMVCVPLLRRDEPVGILKVTAMRPRAFSAADVRTLTGLADFITAAIAASSDLARVTKALLTGGGGSGRSRRRRGAAAGSPREGWDEAAVSAFVANVLRPGIVEDAEVRGRIEQVLAGAELTVDLQPIVNLRSERLVGAEALARFQGPPPQSPDAWFAQAYRVGMGVELELAAVREAVKVTDRLADGVFLAVNVGPEAVSTGRLPAILACGGAHRIVVELTEHIEVGNYERLQDALYEVRASGARLAIDDAGAGFAGLTRILKLAPDLIKLDRELTGGIDLDPVRRSLAAALVSFAAQTGAQIVAEGIETEDELEAVRELGISFGQGYLLGRPGPLSALQRPLAGGAESHPAEPEWLVRLIDHR